jgi:glyoxylase-like metal-dependent hydrolase (beta-lactamase superfamily II)
MPDHETGVTMTINVGDARVTALLDAEGSFFLPLREAFPDADDDAWAAAERIDPGSMRDPGGWWLAFRAYVVELGDQVVLVDTGAASDTPTRSAWAPRGPHLTERLQAAGGLTPDDVSHVVLTHLHGDHTAGSVDVDGHPAFPHAEYLVPAADIAAADSSDAPLRAALVEPLRRSGQLRPSSGEIGLAGGATEITVVPTPGHTPGHQSVVVEHRPACAILAGDVVLHAVQLVEPDTHYVHDDDQALAARSRRDLVARWRSTAGLLGTAHLGLPWVSATSLAALSGRPET